jgi:glycosyltransferase involved in cell wall biosynthesis
MRVLQVTPRYEPRVGGVESHVGEVSRRLAGKGHEVQVLTSDLRRGEESHVELDGVSVSRMGSFAPGGKLHVQPLHWLSGSDVRWDVVHVHNYHSATAVLAALGPVRSRLVFTPHYHGAGSTRLTDLLMRPYRTVAGRAVRGADRVVAVSNWEAWKLMRDLGVNEANVIPHGLDYDAIADERPLDIGQDFALMVGRLEPYKRPMAAVRALEHTDLSLVLVGEGPEEGRIRGAADDMGLGCRLLMPGRLPEAELRGLMHSASVALNLSSREAFGMTVGESLARGTPAVVSGDQALREWTDKSGVALADPGQPEDVALAMEEAAELEPDRQPLPDWAEVVDELEEVYHD